MALGTVFAEHGVPGVARAPNAELEAALPSSWIHTTGATSGDGETVAIDVLRERMNAGVVINSNRKVVGRGQFENSSDGFRRAADI